MKEIRISGVAVEKGVVSIDYSYGGNDSPRENIKLTSSELGRKALYDSFAALQHYVQREFQLTDRLFVMRSVKLSYDSKERIDSNGRIPVKHINVVGFTEKQGYAYMSVKMKAERFLWEIVERSLIGSEEEREDKKLESLKAYDDLIGRLCDEAVLYIKGKRAQGQLFEEEEGNTDE